MASAQDRGFRARRRPLPRTGEISDLVPWSGGRVLANRAEELAFHPVMDQVYDDTERDSWVFSPVRC